MTNITKLYTSDWCWEMWLGGGRSFAAFICAGQYIRQPTMNRCTSASTPLQLSTLYLLICLSLEEASSSSLSLTRKRLFAWGHLHTYFSIVVVVWIVCICLTSFSIISEAFSRLHSIFIFKGCCFHFFKKWIPLDT